VASTFWTLSSPPWGPVAPAAPVAPVGPVAPLAPCAPVAPAAPVAPVGPVAPVAPGAPVAPVAPVAPGAPRAPAAPAGPGRLHESGISFFLHLSVAASMTRSWPWPVSTQPWIVPSPSGIDAYARPPASARTATPSRTRRRLSRLPKPFMYPPFLIARTA